MKHLELEQLKNYGTRRLNAKEMTAAVLHLDECAACFDIFQTLFPDLSDAAREISLAELTADEAEIFHLDYDAHLRPFVDDEADAATREIVESHSANCANCARAVRELREFSDILLLQQAANKSDAFGAADDRFRRLTTVNVWRLALPAAAILILGIGGWLVWRKPAANNFIAEVRPSNNTIPVLANEESFYGSPENFNANREIKTPHRRAENDSTKVDKVGGLNRESKQSKDETSLAALPSGLRAQVQNAVRTGKISLPSFIADLRRTNNLRGAAGDEKNIILAPNAQAERSLRPTFRWRKFGGGDDYIVTIYDENFNQVAVSPNLRRTKWQSDVSLKRGKIYQWQVRTGASASFYAGRFKTLDGAALGRLKKMESAAPNSPLAHGVGYASEGLLDEAAREFQREIVKNPRGRLTWRLKKSLELP